MKRHIKEEEEDFPYKNAINHLQNFLPQLQIGAL